MVDQKKIEEAVRPPLEGIGEDANREGLRETPDRIARMYGEIFAGMDEDAGEHLAKTFTVESNEIVLVKNITFYSICEHHLFRQYGIDSGADDHSNHRGCYGTLKAAGCDRDA